MDVTAASTLFAWLDQEVWLVTARSGDRRSGLIATFVNQASIVPELPRVVVALSKQHFTRELVEASGAFALHLLAEEQIEFVWRFGLESGRDSDKMAGMSVTRGATGSPLLAEAIGWLDCRVETRLDIGDRVLYVAEVVEGRVTNFAPPLTTKRLMERTPSPRLTQMQRQRHQDSYCDAQAIAAWRGNKSNQKEGTTETQRHRED
jgi:flavin reductase (DIM6/NTAB) family NADH-FMN oxidoreductase RutF